MRRSSAINRGFSKAFMLFTHLTMKTHPRMKTRPMLTILFCLIVFYLVFCALAFLFQTRLIFPRAQAQASLYTTYAPQQITLQRDNVLLQGWQLENPAAPHDMVLLYFGGNAEDVISMLPTLKKIGARFIYTFNYRGYGFSEGSPSQAALYEDALAIYDHIARQHNLDQTQVLVMGRSLGSAVAGYLATQRKTDKLVLLTPLKSATQNGQRMLPLVPVRWLIQHPFDLKAHAAQFTSPVLMLIGDADVVIPPRDSRETYAAITTPKRLVDLPGVGHNNLFDNPNALKAIHEFIGP
jgi:pimeloyl-ACP methyl ester carboxylesterase